MGSQTMTSEKAIATPKYQRAGQTATTASSVSSFSVSVIDTIE
jgi:hypothetical protein